MAEFNYTIMKQLEKEIMISATPDKVWKVLTDFENYHTWNPFIKSLSGKQKEGEKLIVRIHPPESKEMTFNPVLLKFTKNKEIRWKGKLGIKGIFDGEHYLKLVDPDNGQTHFIHGEMFSGILVPFMGKAIQKTEIGFEKMNLALKEKCEAEIVTKEKTGVRKTNRIPLKKQPKRPGTTK